MTTNVLQLLIANNENNKSWGSSGLQTLALVLFGLHTYFIEATKSTQKLETTM